MRTVFSTAIILLFSQSTFAQLYPVLHDADGRPIGNVVSFDAIPDNSEYVTMVSLKGYRAKMRYNTTPYDPPVGSDFPGFAAAEFFESSDCTGDPILAPKVVFLSSGVQINADRSNINTLIELKKLKISGANIYSNGDLIEHNGTSYYVPFDAVPISSGIGSTIRNPGPTGYCEVVNRCELAAWQNFSSFLGFYTVDDPAKLCPGESPGDKTAVLRIDGFTFSSLISNDPAVTGFQNIGYKSPKRIKWIDIKTVLQNESEAKTEPE